MGYVRHAAALTLLISVERTDHTRAFRLATDLQRPAALLRIERSLFEDMKALTLDAVTKSVGISLTRYEIQAMLAQRDVILKVCQAKMAERGEGAVIYTLAR